jgi:hypothetical protein
MKNRDVGCWMLDVGPNKLEPSIFSLNKSGQHYGAGRLLLFKLIGYFALYGNFFAAFLIKASTNLVVDEPTDPEAS